MLATWEYPGGVDNQAEYSNLIDEIATSSHQWYCSVWKNFVEKLVDKKVLMPRFPVDLRVRKFWIQLCKDSQPNFVSGKSDTITMSGEHFVVQFGPRLFVHWSRWQWTSLQTHGISFISFTTRNWYITADNSWFSRKIVYSIVC